MTHAVLTRRPLRQFALGLAVSLTMPAPCLMAGNWCDGDPVCGCEQPVCGCEVACGCEQPMTCFEEPACGCEQPVCGCEATCGAEMACATEIQCGCEASCDIEVECGCETRCDGGCDGRGKPKFADRLKQKTASMKRHMKKIFGVKSSASCDDGCDAMMMEELAAPVHSYAPAHNAPITVPSHAHTQRSLPKPIVRAPAPPRGNVRRRIDSGVVVPSPPADNVSSRVMPLRDAMPSNHSFERSTDLSDALDLDADVSTNPFLDDDAQLNRPLRVRRTAYRYNHIAN